MCRKTCVAALVMLALNFVDSRALAVPAFSGAEGWGAITPGGRGGQVIHVTNLNDSGPGSFRAAVTASGPRTVVFDVAGQIDLLSEVNVLDPYLTIAGQTAPGDGITIAGETVSLDTHDIVVRYLRFRRGLVDYDRRDDALGSDSSAGNIIVDHVSTSWGLDENISFYRWKDQVTGAVWPTHNVTIQWSISSEALNAFSHAFGATWGGAGANYHHNLFADNTGRNPSISFSHFLDLRNNVSFNWQYRTADGAGEEAHVNMINNYMKPGPATNFGPIQYRIVKPEIRSGVAGPGAAGWWYVDGNYTVGYPGVTADNWNGGVQFDLPMLDEWAKVDVPHTNVYYNQPGDPNNQPIPTLPTIATQTAEDAYLSVLAGAGASLARDAVDLRIVDSVATGIATFGPNGDGIINNPGQAGGYPVIPYVERSVDWDVDRDGMPGYWEREHGLVDWSAGDRNGDFDSDGFTNLEEYLNEVGAFQAVKDIVWDGEANNRYAQIENWDIAFQPSRYDTAVINNGTVLVDAVGQHAGTLKLGANVGDNATLNITSGWLKVADELIIGADPGATAVLNLSGGELSVETLSKGAGGTFDFNGGTLHADEVAFDLVNDGGTLAPGNSNGQTHVSGDLTINSGTLEIEIASAADFDTVLVDNTATLGGQLEVLLDGFLPASTDVFEILTADTLTGTFSNAPDLLYVGVGTFDVTYSGTSVVLSDFALATDDLWGDYNDNGTVDAADYSVWRDNLGSSSTLPNDLTPGTVDEFDYGIWKTNFGQIASGGGSLASVPEPASLALLVLGLLSVVFGRRRGSL